jgi:hypothetical protein
MGRDRAGNFKETLGGVSHGEGRRAACSANLCPEEIRGFKIIAELSLTGF